MSSTAIVTLRQQRGDLLAHLLHYVHQRRGRTLDVRADRRPSDVYLVPEDRPLAWDWDDGYVRFRVPRVDGYQIVQLAGAAA